MASTPPTFVHHALDLGPGRRIAVADAGQGPPVVLVHGAFLTGRDWTLGPATALARRRRVLVPDRPGHGDSTRQRSEATPLRQASAVREAIGRLNAERPVLVGHSFGGLVALAWAAAWPDEVQGLVLIAPLAFPEVRLIEKTLYGPRALPFAGEAFAVGARIGLDPLATPLIDSLIFSPQPAPEVWRTGFPHDQVTKPSAGIANGEDSWAVAPWSPGAYVDFARIRAPARVLYGDADRVVDPRRHALRLPSAIPGARVRALPGLGHMPHWFAPDALAEAVDEVSAVAAVRV